MTALRQLRLVALLEGTSFLVLLFIAMPLKYLAGLPVAVRIVGSVHGVLFLMFMAVLYRAGSARGWPRRRWLIAFVSSVVPFGTFMFDRSLRREIAEVTESTESAPDVHQHDIGVVAQAVERDVATAGSDVEIANLKT